MITESFRQILFQVAIAVLELRSSTVTLHTKTNLWRRSGQQRVIPLYQESDTDKTGSETGHGGLAGRSYKSNRAAHTGRAGTDCHPLFVVDGSLILAWRIRNDSR